MLLIINKKKRNLNYIFDKVWETKFETLSDNFPPSVLELLSIFSGLSQWENYSKHLEQSCTTQSS